jgi:DNA polymerase III subunit beta
MNTKDIKATCKRIKAFISNRPTLPILSYVKVESDGSRLTLTGYDMEIGAGIRAGLPIHSTTFATCVRFSDLEKIVGKLKSDSLDIIPTDREITGYDNEKSSVTDLTIKSGGLSFTLNGKLADDYPPLPGPSGEPQAVTVCEYGKLTQELSFVLKATDHDSTPRNFTSGVLFDYRADGSNLVGTDGRRLHKAFIPGQNSTDPYAFIPPVKPLESLVRLNVSDSHTIDLHFYENLLTWSVPDSDLSGMIHLMDTPYPEYEKVIPDWTNVFKLDSKATVQALDALSVIAHERDGRDMVVINANGRLNLSVNADSVGKANADLPLIHLASEVGQGTDEIRVALNIDYFGDILKQNESADGLIQMSNSQSLDPCRFDYTESGRIAVLMPVRLPESD